MKSAPHIPETSHTALIQIIDLSWDKSARGGKLSAQRNAVPSAFVIPAERLLSRNGGTAYIEEQKWGHSNGFVHPLRCQHHEQPLSEAYKRGCITVQYSQSELNVVQIWNWWDVGAPERSPMKKVAVPMDTWARVRWNGRVSGMDSGIWTYHQVTVNIALCSGQPDGDAFIKTKPHRQLEQMASLW